MRIQAFAKVQRPQEASYRMVMVDGIGPLTVALESIDQEYTAVGMQSTGEADPEISDVTHHYGAFCPFRAGP